MDFTGLMHLFSKFMSGARMVTMASLGALVVQLGLLLALGAGSRRPEAAEVAAVPPPLPPTVESPRMSVAAEPVALQEEARVRVPASFSILAAAVAPEAVTPDSLDEVCDWVDLTQGERHAVLALYQQWLSDRQRLEAEHATVVRGNGGNVVVEIAIPAGRAATLDARVVGGLRGVIGEGKAGFFEHFFSREFATAEAKRVLSASRSGPTSLSFGTPSRRSKGAMQFGDISRETATSRFGALIDLLTPEDRTP